jgi:hypothetical protein
VSTVYSLDYYCANVFWKVLLYRPDIFTQFIVFLHENFDRTVYIGNYSDSEKTIKTLFPNVVALVRGPERNAYAEAASMRKKLFDAFENSGASEKSSGKSSGKSSEKSSGKSSERTLVVACAGVYGRCLSRDLYEKVTHDNQSGGGKKGLFILDMGSVMDLLHGRITRGWMRKEVPTGFSRIQTLNAIATAFRS